MKVIPRSDPSATVFLKLIHFSCRVRADVFFKLKLIRKGHDVEMNYKYLLLGDPDTVLQLWD